MIQAELPFVMKYLLNLPSVEFATCTFLFILEFGRVDLFFCKAELVFVIEVSLQCTRSFNFARVELLIYNFCLYVMYAPGRAEALWPSRLSVLSDHASCLRRDKFVIVFYLVVQPPPNLVKFWRGLTHRRV